MFEILFDRIIAEQREAGLMNISTADLLIQRIQKFLYRGAAVEAHDLIRAVQKVNRYGVWQGMMVRILHQYR